MYCLWKTYPQEISPTTSSLDALSVSFFFLIVRNSWMLRTRSTLTWHSCCFGSFGSEPAPSKLMTTYGYMTYRKRHSWNSQRVLIAQSCYSETQLPNFYFSRSSREKQSQKTTCCERNVLWCLRCCCTITRVSSGFLWSGAAVSFIDAWPHFWDSDRDFGTK